VRDARFVSLTDDGQGLVLEHEGRHLRLPLDARVRAALAGEAQIPMPLETRVSPRDIQHRLRCGESASQIAAAAGVGVEQIARFEGPVVAERDWHVDRARKTVVDEVSLAERVDAAVTHAGGDPAAVEWQAWLSGDQGWRVRVALPDGRVAAWAWDPRTRRLRARDDLARVIVSGDIAGDDLDAVLRPVAAAREAQRAAATVVSLRAVEPEPADDEPAPGFTDEPLPVREAVEPDPQPETDADEAEPADPPPTASASARKRRAVVPSWDEIVMGSSKRSDDG
jgi:hypothetical protein